MQLIGLIVTFFTGVIIGVLMMGVFSSNSYEHGYNDGKAEGSKVNLTSVDIDK